MLVHAKVKGGQFDNKQWCYMEMKPGGLVSELMDFERQKESIFVTVPPQ